MKKAFSVKFKYAIAVAMLFLVASCNKEDNVVKNERSVKQFEESLFFTPELQIVDNKHEISVTATYDQSIVYWHDEELSFPINVQVIKLTIFDEDREMASIANNNKVIVNEYSNVTNIKYVVEYALSYTIITEHDIKTGSKSANVDIPNVDFDFNVIVKFDYPFERQRNYMQSDFQYGFLYFNATPSFLETSRNTYHVVITDIAENISQEAVMTYNSQRKILQYPMPVLENNKIYRVDYVVSDSQGNKKEFFRSNHFATSEYNRFSEKFELYLLMRFERLVYAVDAASFVGISRRVYSTVFDPAETFDFYEFINSPEVYRERPISLLSSIIDDNVKLHNDELYSLGIQYNIPLTRRDTDYYGYKPFRNLFMMLNSSVSPPGLITDEEILNKRKQILSSYSVVFQCIYPIIISWDHDHLYSNVMRFDVPWSEKSQIRDELFKFRSADYRLSPSSFSIQYIIPFIEELVFEHKFDFPENCWGTLN